jgi:hypothetical protein
MKKSIYISTLILFMATTVKAQLIFSTGNKVAIIWGSEPEVFEPLLMVYEHDYFESSANASIGTAAAPDDYDNVNTIGVYGGFGVGSNTSYGNYGVLGSVATNTLYNGRNYGLCGMINSSDNNFVGGAGIYATDCDYCYYCPISIWGAYAGYFVGNVNTLGNLTTTSLFTIMDSRLIDNTVSLSKSKRSGVTTLENLLNMNVVEYNLKGRQFEEIPEDVDPEKAEGLRKELEFLKKEEQKMASRRHFGVDARELQKVYPGLVLEGQDGNLSVNYLEMVPLVIRSIQELKQELDELTDTEVSEE